MVIQIVGVVVPVRLSLFRTVARHTIVAVAKAPIVARVIHHQQDVAVAAVVAAVVATVVAVVVALVAAVVHVVLPEIVVRQQMRQISQRGAAVVRLQVLSSTAVSKKVGVSVKDWSAVAALIVMNVQALVGVPTRVQMKHGVNCVAVRIVALVKVRRIVRRVMR